jgi:hypothetical protein
MITDDILGRLRDEFPAEIHGARQSISLINNELRDIEQVMLYAGRLHSGTLAEAALDVAIAIHGEPDDAEKLYAQNITIPLFRKDKARAMHRLDRSTSLQSAIDRLQASIGADLTKLTKLEGKYEYASKLISTCIFTAAGAILIFLTLKFLL